MGDLLYLPGRPVKGNEGPLHGKSWAFCRAPWSTVHFAQMLRSQAEGLTSALEKGGGKTGHPQIPTHFVLTGGLCMTIQTLFCYRHQEDRMREAYYLFGLMDCMMSKVNPLLRTDLLRSLYKKVFALKDTLNIRWTGQLDHVLLPLHPEFFSEGDYRAEIEKAGTMKRLYEVIRGGTDDMFAILGTEYVFFTPHVG